MSSIDRGEKTTTTVVAAELMEVRNVSVICPHCGNSQAGWLSDPRGGTHECDHCRLSYWVPPDIRIDF